MTNEKAMADLILELLVNYTVAEHLPFTIKKDDGEVFVVMTGKLFKIRVTEVNLE